MDVVIDGNNEFSFKSSPRNALEAVAIICNDLHAHGRAMMQLCVDGLDIPPENLQRELADKPLESITRVEIATESVAALVDACLANLEQALPELPNACHRLAEVFQSERPEEGFEPFQQLADAWMAIKEQERQVASALELEMDQLAINGIPFSELHDGFNRFLNEAADAIGAYDYVLLGDLLEYELAPRAETETAIVATLRVHAQQQAAR